MSQEYAQALSWATTPYAFNVISRTILSDFKSKAKGDAGICTDDLMGVCSHTELVEDMTWARACIEGTCGDKSVAEDKTETSADQLVFIGWSMDLTLQVLGIARHNVLKNLLWLLSSTRTNTSLHTRTATVGFASVSVQFSLPVHEAVFMLHLQRLCGILSFTDTGTGH